MVAFFVPEDATFIARGAEFIRVMCLTWGAIGVQLCMVATFRASGNMLISMVIALVSQWMLHFPLAYILSKHTPLHTNGLWWSFPVTNIIAAIVAAAWFAQGSWRKTRLTEQEKQVAIIADETIVEDGLP